MLLVKCPTFFNSTIDLHGPESMVEFPCSAVRVTRGLNSTIDLHVSINGRISMRYTVIDRFKHANRLA